MQFGDAGGTGFPQELFHTYLLLTGPEEPSPYEVHLVFQVKSAQRTVTCKSYLLPSASFLLAQSSVMLMMYSI